MINVDHLTLFSPDGNETLKTTLEESGFKVLAVSEEKDIPSGIVVMDLLSPEPARKYLLGRRSGLQRLRSAGYTVVVAVSSDTLKSDEAALAVGSAHAFLLDGEGAASTRATVLAAIHRRALDVKLKRSEQQYRLVAEHVGDIVWTLNLETQRYDFMSPSVLPILGYTMEEALDSHWEESITPESRVKARDQLVRACSAVTPLRDYYDQICKDGSVKTMEITISTINDPDGKPTHLLGVARDATERVRDKINLEAALRQREVLLKELEHRVKNTLAMISSLLSLASEQVKDPEDAGLFEESQTRVDALALVYQKLLRSSDAARIDLGLYLSDLCSSVRSSFSRDAAEVDIEVGKDSFTVDSRIAAPIGLAVNELVTNSIKYAILPDRGLKLNLEVRRPKEGTVDIRYGDNGPGLPAGFDVEKSTGLGFLLLRNLVSQLNGEFSLESGGEGARFRITFPYDS